MDSERIQVIAQSIIAVVVVLGGGIAIAINPDTRDIFVPVITFVVGFYFSQAATRTGAKTAIHTLTMQSRTEISARENDL